MGYIRSSISYHWWVFEIAQEMVLKWMPWKPIEDNNEDNLFDRDKKEEEILMMTILIFVIPKKLKIDKMDKSICEKKLGDDEKKTVKLILNPFFL